MAVNNQGRKLIYDGTQIPETSGKVIVPGQTINYVRAYIGGSYKPIWCIHDGDFPTLVQEAFQKQNCDQGQKDKYKCPDCGDTILKANASYPATDHSWDSGTVITAATTTSTGLRKYHCTRVWDGVTCTGTKEEVIPKIVIPIVDYTSNEDSSLLLRSYNPDTPSTKMEILSYDVTPGTKYKAIIRCKMIKTTSSESGCAFTGIGIGSKVSTVSHGLKSGSKFLTVEQLFNESSGSTLDKFSYSMPNGGFGLFGGSGVPSSAKTVWTPDSTSIPRLRKNCYSYKNSGTNTFVCDELYYQKLVFTVPSGVTKVYFYGALASAPGCPTSIRLMYFAAEG